MQSLPHSRSSGTAIDTNGVAFAIPTGNAAPWFPATQAAIYVSALAYIGWGTSGTVPAAATSNTVYQEGTTVVDYTVGFPSDASDTPISHIYIYAASGTVDARVSWFG